MTKWQLPAGWERLVSCSLLSAGITRRKVKYLFQEERLVVRRKGKKWLIFHNGLPTCPEFETAKEAIEHCEDARFGG